MHCKNPYVVRGQAFGCGQCLPCRVNKRREWTHRMILEAAQYSDNCFLTLTYNDDHLPSDKSLQPKDMQLFIKKLRKSMEPRLIRYFGVGEYGDQTERPHYHLAVFNMPSCSRGNTSVRRDGTCCSVCDGVRALWGKGNVYLGRIEPQSAQYVVGYVTKKLTKKDDPKLNGRHPEFARMSLRPGIGAGLMEDVASTLLEHNLDRPEDVPNQLMHGKTKLPLGRYLRNRIAERIGVDPKEVSKINQAKAQEKLRPLQEATEANAPKGFKRFYFKNLVIDAGEGKRIQLESRFKRNSKRGTL